MISFIKKNKFELLTANIVLIYMVGITGILKSDSEQERFSFMLLTPLNMVMNCIMLLSFHKPWNYKFLWSALFVAFIGFIIEIAGVRTGVIFGHYHYGNSLGFKLLDVPVLMALNWFLLIYATATMLYKIRNIFLFSLSGAVIITALDLLIEPLCTYLHFWFWDENIPVQNFVAWFAISFILLYFFRKINKNISNPYGVIIMLMQYLFFSIINVHHYCSLH